jgi:hypothetical protein
MTAIHYHRCGVPAEEDGGAVRAVCASCSAWLHCCRNCELYLPGAHNDCREPNAERIADKEAGNFCDWFRPSGRRAEGEPGKVDARARLERLFARKPPDRRGP